MMNLQAASRDGTTTGRSLPGRINPFAAAVAAPPIPQADGWIASYDGSQGPVIDLSQAVPGHAPPAAYLQSFAALGATPAAARYGAILGDAALRDAYAGHVSQLYGADLSPSEVAITAGCNQAFFVAVMAVAAAGEAVILPTPWYFNHQMTLAMLGITAEPVATEAEAGFVPAPAQIEAAVTGKTRAVVLVSPNNPTGAGYPPATIAEIFQLCRRRGLFLILDETYRDFLPADDAPHALFGAEDWGDTLVSLYSFSKSYAIPGHRVGAMLAGPKVLGAAEKILDSLQICTPRPSQAALAPAIEGLAAWRREKVDEIIGRAAIFRQSMEALGGWRLDQIGAYFAYLRHPFEGQDCAAVAEALARRLGLLVLPGSFFGPGQERHLRVAFANVDAERIAAFAERLAGADALFPSSSGMMATHG